MAANSAFARARRELAKLSDSQLVESNGLRDALTLSLTPCEPQAEADRLAYLVLCLKRIPKLLQANPSQTLLAILDENLTRSVAASKLQLAIQSGLNSSHKTIQARATDALIASKNVAVALGGEVPTNPARYFLDGLLIEPLSSKLVNKIDLSLVATLLDVANPTSIPSDLLETVLPMVPLTDYPALRCRIVLALLELRSREEATPSATANDASCIVAPLLPLLRNPTDPGHLTHFARYLFPLLFERHPQTYLHLLSELQDTQHLPSWILIASTGFNTNVHNIDSLPMNMLEAAAAHPSTDVRLAALSLFTKGNGSIDNVRADLIRRALLWSSNIPSSEFRMSISSIMISFFTSIRSLSAKARRIDPRTSKPAEPSITPAVIEPAQKLLSWMLDDWILPSLLFVNRTSSARILLALRIYNAIATVFAKATIDDQKGAERGTEIHLDLFSRARVDALIGCLASNFTEVRARAEDILNLAPSPLPAYPSIESPEAQVLLESAYSCILGARNTDAEAGKALLRLVFEKLVRDVKKEEQSSAVSFTNDVIDRLESHIVASEENLVKGMALQPLHGLLSAVREVISAVDFENPDTVHLWRPVLIRARSLVSRTWAVCRVVLSATATQSTADHEIARARDALHNRVDADVEGGDEDAEEVGDGDHLILLSGCWRAMKEAGDLLSTLIALPLKARTRAKVPLPPLWSEDEIISSGDLFLTWLHEIRHRGTFSKLSLAFGRVIEVVRPFEEVVDAGLAGCCMRWLLIEIDTVQSNQVSTTRRSAALPYCILSIVSGNVKLLDAALSELFELARVSNESSSDDTKVHAFNSIRVVLLDARQAFIFERYFEQAVVLAVDAFASNNWNVRNVGLILLSTLLSRSFSNSKKQDSFGNRQTLAGRQPFQIWDAKFPLLLPFFATLLLAEKAQLVETEHSALFPILIVLRNLRATENGREVQAKLRPLVMSNLLSKDWQVREVASQAASSMVLPVDACSIVIPVLQAATPKDQNGLMGYLMFVERVINDVLDPEDGALQQLEDALLASLPLLLEQNNCPPTKAAFVRCVAVFVRLTCRWTSELAKTTVTIAMKILTSTSTRQPGSDLLDVAAAQLVLSADTVESNEFTTLLGDVVFEDVRLLAIDASSGKMSESIGRMATTEAESDAIRIRALEWLQNRAYRVDDIGTLRRAAEQKRCVPLREAALPILALAVAGSASLAASDLVAILSLIESAADEEESHESRFAAVKALSHLSAVLYPAPGSNSSPGAYFVAHQTLYTLLIDDDDEVRAEASTIVGRGITMVQGRAVDEWWNGLVRYLTKVNGGIREAWSHWLWAIVANQAEIDVLLEELEPNPRSQVLFAPEPPNIFREPLIEAQRAADALGKIGIAPDWYSSDEIERLEKALALAAVDVDRLSPIDRRRESVLALQARLRLMRCATILNDSRGN